MSWIIKDRMGKNMKKPTFVIAEIFLSLLLAGSLAAVAVLAVDLNTGGSIIPPELYGGEAKPKQESSEEDKKQESKKEESSQVSSESSAKTSEETSQKTESSADKKKEESSKAEQSKTETKPSDTVSFKDKLILQQPENSTDQPKEMEEFITDYGFDFDILYGDHFIAVDATEGGKADIYCYQKGDNGIWWNISGDGKKFSENAFIGENGPAYEVTPGSKKSPLGFYTLGQGFYIGQKPDSTYSMFEITDDTYWVNDPGSAFYNTKVEGTDRKDWSSAIHMITETEAYKCGIVVNYNTSNIKSDLSSSVFMYCGNAPTEGGIALPESEMLTIREWLDKDSIAMICIMA